jgi:hypothetical protein
MADPRSCRPESIKLDEPQRPPTFIQIHPPAAATAGRRMVLCLVGVGIALVTALGWAVYRLAAQQAAPLVTQATPTLPETLSPPPIPADLYAELVRRETNAAVFAPAWSRESLMDRISPFDAAVPDRQMLSGATPPATRSATQPVSVRLGKGGHYRKRVAKARFRGSGHC